MEKKTKSILAVAIIVAIIVVGSVLVVIFQGQEVVDTININIYVEEWWGVNYSNESLNLEVKEGDYFGVPSLSGFAYIDNGSKIFKLIEIIDSEHVKVQFNESMLFNFTDKTGTRIYYENPLILSTNMTVFTTRPLNEWLVMDPYPIVDIHLSIFKSG